MKKLILFMLMAPFALAINAQTPTRYLHVSQLDGTTMEIAVNTIDSMDFITKTDPVLSHNGHEYVDLGLATGTLWATCNVGALKPEQAGGYFAWGETKAKEYYNWANEGEYKFGVHNWDAANHGMSKYCKQDGLTVLDSIDDAAAVHWGGEWRTPTDKELAELYNTCDWEWDVEHRGYKVVGPNGKSIFIPAAGYRYGTQLYVSGTVICYWASTRQANNANSDYVVSFHCAGNDGYLTNGGYLRCYGFSIRPVLTPAL